LTAWELDQYGSLRNHRGQRIRLLPEAARQKVLFGADRVAANGDVANKIGTYMLALAARDNDVPAYAVVQPRRWTCRSRMGADPDRRARSAEVLTSVRGERVTLLEAGARNPAFDVTRTAW
jgi:methylthioribose-1-phosphate isomerase